MNVELKRIFCFVLCLTLAAGCAGMASAAGKVRKGIEINDLGDITDDWYYVTDTVPDGYLNQEKISLRIYTNDGTDLDPEDAETCEITFKSGEERLKDALVAEKDENGIWYAYVDNNALTVPGKAVFHFVAESPSFLYERDFTINVLDWNEYPLLVVEHEHPVIDATLGQVIKDEELMAGIGQLNTSEIFNKVLKLKTRSWMSSDYFIPRTNYAIEYSGNALERVYAGSFLESRYDTAVRDYGDHEIQLTYFKGNIKATFPMTISVRGYNITASRSITQGADISYSVNGTTEGRSFTWSVEGEGATIDPESGVLTVSNDAPAGTVFTVTATADNGDTVSVREFYAGADSLFDGVTFSQISAEGFQVPAPTGISWNMSSNSYYQNEIFTAFGFTEQGIQVVIDAYYDEPTSALHFAENPEVARAEIQKDLNNYAKVDADAEQEIIELDGHPVGLVTFSDTSWGQTYNVGALVYLRNNRDLRLRAYTQVYDGQTARVTLNDMKQLAYKLSYDENQAPLSAAKAKFTVSGKDGISMVSAGKNLQMEATFENADLINKKEKNDGIDWSVANAENGEENPAATIARNGQLKIDKSLEAPVNLTVKGVSSIFGTEATFDVYAIPAVSKVMTEPSELFFYVGTENPQTVKAVLDPDTVPLVGITWTAAKEGIIEISEVEDGTVSIKPLAGGRTDVAVKEPGGKNAKLSVSVVDPVESVELTLKGNAKPGGSVTVSAALQPKTAGNKNVEWSLDVGEDVATINEKGQVKISKETVSGTKITVTCKALGAPEPIISTIEIEIP